MTSVSGGGKNSSPASVDECVIPAKIARQVSLGTSPAPRLYLFTHHFTVQSDLWPPSILWLATLY